jgi:P27 family predicted phage terminase small subunit
MPGPPPTPTRLHLLRGNPSHLSRRQLHKGEPQPARGDACPDPPAFLDQYAAEEWRRVAPELWNLGLLTVLDHMTFAVYCRSVGRWLQAEELLANADPVVEGSADNQVVNPLIKIAIESARNVVRFAGEFGMTPSSRARVRAGVDPPRPPSKFGDLLACE